MGLHSLVAPSVQSELVDRNLLPASDVAPRLRQTKIQLEHAITRDQLGHLLEARPPAEQLISHNVLQVS